MEDAELLSCLYGVTFPGTLLTKGKAFLFRCRSMPALLAVGLSWASGTCFNLSHWLQQLCPAGLPWSLESASCFLSEFQEVDLTWEEPSTEFFIASGVASRRRWELQAGSDLSTRDHWFAWASRLFLLFLDS